MEVSFTILGNPIGKERHRTSVLPNGKIHTYNSEKNTSYERLTLFLEMKMMKSLNQLLNSRYLTSFVKQTRTISIVALS